MELLFRVSARASGDPAELAYSDLAAGRYLQALRRLKQCYISRERTPLAANFLMWALNAVDPWDSAWSLSGGGEPFPQGARLVDPIEPIGKAMRTRRVVVLMEAHRAPETRYFGARVLLPALRAAGATHLAYETAFQSTVDRFQRTGTVQPATEVYAFDPSRAALLRSARRLGLRIVAFDFPAEGYVRAGVKRLLGQQTTNAATLNAEREQYMAENISRLILRRDPAARVVVWTGEQHAMKHTPPDWPWQHPFMAACLARLSDTEPFCIWQTCVDAPDLASSPRLLIGGHPSLQDRGVDATVLHHRGQLPGRPSWLDRGTKAVPVRSNGAELIQALPADEGRNAVPTAQALVTSDPQPVHLAAGPYLVRGLRGMDEVVWETSLRVEAEDR